MVSNLFKIQEGEKFYIVRVTMIEVLPGITGEEGKCLKEEDVVKLPDKDLAEATFNLVVGVGKTTYQATEVLFEKVGEDS